MKRERGRTIEVETLAEFDDRVRRGAATMAGWHVRSLDLRGRTAQLIALDPAGSLFLGCTFDSEVENALRARGALIFPKVPDVPVDQYRSSLYTPHELYDGLDSCYEETLDARVYAWSKQPQVLDVSLAKALHDHAIDTALDACLAERGRIVGMMGGHDRERGSEEYADAAHLGMDLAEAGLFLCTGGGPGAMEAGNLGAYFSGDRHGLDQALRMLADVPRFVPSVDAWAGTAFDVLRHWPRGADSLGIPTWHYGHEPPNAFATHIAKYFKNAIREDILLQVCEAGIVFLPGSGGTVQEIFQDACENYYADPATVAPMILVGRSHWTEELPAWPLLESLARGRTMEGFVHLVDDVDEVLPLLAG